MADTRYRVAEARKRDAKAEKRDPEATYCTIPFVGNVREANSRSRKADRWGLGAGGWGQGADHLMSMGSLWGPENALELDGSGGWTTFRVHRTPLNCSVYRGLI